MTDVLGKSVFPSIPSLQKECKCAAKALEEFLLPREGTNYLVNTYVYYFIGFRAPGIPHRPQFLIALSPSPWAP